MSFTYRRITTGRTPTNAYTVGLVDGTGERHGFATEDEAAAYIGNECSTHYPYVLLALTAELPRPPLWLVYHYCSVSHWPPSFHGLEAFTPWPRLAPCPFERCFRIPRAGFNSVYRL